MTDDPHPNGYPTHPQTDHIVHLTRLRSQELFPVALLDIDGNLVQANEAFTKLAGIHLPTKWQDNLMSFMDEESRKHLEEYNQMIEISTPLTPFSRSIILMHRSSDDHSPWELDLFAHPEWTGPYRLLSDIASTRADHSQSIAEAADSILENLSHLMVQMVASENQLELQSKTLASLGEMAGVDRVYLTRLAEHPDNEAASFEFRLWSRPDVPEPHSLSLFRCPQKVEPGDNRVLPLTPADYPSSLRRLAVAEEILALLVYPVFVEDKWWGEIGLCQSTPIDHWPESHRHALRIAGAALGTLTEKMKLTQSFQESESRVAHLQKMESLGRMAGGIAHEFNNSLAAIIGHAHLLEEEMISTPKCHEYLESILHAGNRAADVVKSMLAFSRKPVARPRDGCDVSTALRDLYPLLRGMITEDINLSMVLDDKPMRIGLTKGQLEQIVVNLTVNAKQALKTGGTGNSISCSAFRRNLSKTGKEFLPPGEYVLLKIEDTGIGMSEAVRQNAVEPFFTTKPPGEGLGLGLAIIHELIVGTGGGLQIESEENQGTSINVFLPLLISESISEEAEVIPRGNMEKILIVEDEPLVRRTAEHYLKELNYNTHSVESGNAAVKTLEDGYEPNLALIDLVMPGMSGIDLSKWIRANRPNIRILFMTGYFAPKTLDIEYLPTGESNLISKPFTIPDLAQKLRAQFGADEG